jgi:hypothetical protein
MKIDERSNPEQPIIRPPSEWRSTLIRITRGCHWNRCRFCGIYPHLGEPGFSERSFEEIAHDISLLEKRRPESREFFLGDADPLHGGVELTENVIRLLYQKFSIKKITCYARISTLKALGIDALKHLFETGLTRVHMGLESGDSEVLRYQRKGQSPEMAVIVADWLHEAGIEASFYVLLGLGGSDRWREHMIGTAATINKTQPEFVRIRRLWIYESGADNTSGCPLAAQVLAGKFTPQTADGSVKELQLLLTSLVPSRTYLTCDHSNNFIQVHGFLNKDLEQMRRDVDSFLALPENDRLAYYARHPPGI